MASGPPLASSLLVSTWPRAALMCPSPSEGRALPGREEEGSRAVAPEALPPCPPRAFDRSVCIDFSKVLGVAR